MGWGVAQVYTRAPGFGPNAWVHELAPETVRPDETEEDVKRRMAKKYKVKVADIRLEFPLERNPRRRKISKRAARLMGSRKGRNPRTGVRREFSRKNPITQSERRAWYDARHYAREIKQYQVPEVVKMLADNIDLIAEHMIAQLKRGIHENPTLAILGNPGKAKVVGTLSRRLYELRYQHAKDGKDYRHPFGPGASVLLLSDGNVLIRAKHRLWEDI